MESDRFDRLAKRVGAGLSRRRLVTGLLGTVLAGMTLLRRSSPASAAICIDASTGTTCAVNSASECTHCGCCPSPLVCDLNLNECVDPTCTPSCEGTTCGDDGCGGLCACAAGQTCCGGVCHDACPVGQTLDETTCACVADATGGGGGSCLGNGARCGRAGDQPCCSGRCARKRGRRTRVCRRAAG